MSSLKNDIALIYRASKYSPNLIDADRRILEAVGENLLGQGYGIKFYGEDDVLDVEIEQSTIIHMCRSDKALSRLQEYKNYGYLVINTPTSIKNCTRRKIYKLFTQKMVLIPETTIVETNSSEQPFGNTFAPCWLKLPDAPTVNKEDIIYASTYPQYIEALKTFAKNRHKEAIVTKHLSGDLIKFYSVAGEDFIHVHYPTERGYSKFGYEEHNGLIKNIPYNIENLQAICNRAAQAIGITVYGGDAIVTDTGEIFIIDFNDWPSFSPCVELGAKYISKHIIERITKG